MSEWGVYNKRENYLNIERQVVATRASVELRFITVRTLFRLTLCSHFVSRKHQARRGRREAQKGKGARVLLLSMHPPQAPIC